MHIYTNLFLVVTLSLILSHTHCTDSQLNERNQTSNQVKSMSVKSNKTSAYLYANEQPNENQHSREKKKDGISQIKNKLHQKQVDSCTYGDNPRLIDMCPELMANKTQSLLNSISNISLGDIENSIINFTIVKKLKNCFVGDWCLKESFYTVNPKDNTLEMQINKNFNVVASCQFATCYDRIAPYIKKCVGNTVTHDVLSMAAKMCSFNAHKTDNQYCPEQTLRLIHVTVAAFTSNINQNLTSEVTKPNICEEDVLNQKCSLGCKRLAMALNKIESCCANSKLFSSVSLLNWYFIQNREIEQFCDLPITSICWSDGKYYLGISPDILIFSVIASVVITSVTLLGIYVCCCRRGSFLPDVYDYSQLSAEDDDNNESEAEKKNKTSQNVGFDNETKTLIYDFNNNMSEFVNNKKDMDIRGLIN